MLAIMVKYTNERLNIKYKWSKKIKYTIKQVELAKKPKKRKVEVKIQQEVEKKDEWTKERSMKKQLKNERKKQQDT
jgi:hypothetical protein